MKTMIADVPPDWISVSGFARKYEMDRSIVWKWLRNDQLIMYRVGRVVRIRDVPPDRHFRQRRKAGFDGTLRIDFPILGMTPLPPNSPEEIARLRELPYRLYLDSMW